MKYRIFVVSLLLVVGVVACGKKKPLTDGTIQPDKYLFDHGTEMLNKGNWVKAHEYFQQLYDNYPQSPYRTDAKLGLGDAYLGVDTGEALVLAANEYKEFLSYFPTDKRADYAQYRLGCAYAAQMLKPGRDQSQTKEAIKALQAFVEKYPDSALLGEAQKQLRMAKDRLSDSNFNVGLFYFRQKWYPGAIDRFHEVLSSDPEYTRRDQVYYYMAESLLKINRNAEALPYFERLVEEFQHSEFAAKAQVRIKELKG